MSIWTHVIGTIRVDGMPKLFPGYTKEKLEEILGPQSPSFSLYDDARDFETETILPTGSEGTLAYLVHEYYNGLPWAIIAIWGDLRDYDSVDEIKDWWKETLYSLHDNETPMIIRDAVLRIEVEGQEEVVVTNSVMEALSF